MGVDVLDLTDLQKRGLLKYVSQRDVVSAETLDLTQFSDNTADSSQVEQSSNDSSSAFDLLSSFAQASAPSSEVSQTSNPSANSSDVHGKLDTIISKMEDVMYKIELLSGRVAQMEAKFR